MDVRLDLASVAKLIGEPSRATMLNALFYVEALPASDLARRANITPQTASAHLMKLCEADLLKVEQHGRHRYYHLASAEVAQLLESLLSLSQHEMVEGEETLEPMYYARTCYDHLAGWLGVALVDALQAKGWLMPQNKDFLVSAKGEAAFLTMGINLSALKKQRRQFARQCLDWTERRYHMSGALGAALTEYLLKRKWLLKPEGGRVVHVSSKGVKGLKDVFGLNL